MIFIVGKIAYSLACLTAAISLALAFPYTWNSQPEIPIPKDGCHCPPNYEKGSCANAGFVMSDCDWDFISRLGVPAAHMLAIIVCLMGIMLPWQDPQKIAAGIVVSKGD